MAAGFNETLQWTMGLINASGKYLTAETFGFKINANGANMKTKQIWTLETKAGDDQYIYLRSPHKRYLAGNEKGEVTASDEEMVDNARFLFLPQADGRCALKSSHGYYFGGSGDHLSCFSKAVSENELWTIHLAMHPQINLRNIQRKCYAHLVGSEVRINEEIPWGADAMITLEFDRSTGKYMLRLANDKYLSRQGRLQDELSDDTRFQLEFHGSTIAFKDCAGKYLAGVGGTATMQSRRDVVDKDERFVLEDSHPQMQLTGENGRLASITRGVEVSAVKDPDDATDTEIFQLEINKETNLWSIRASNKKYLSVSSITVSATAASRDETCWFDISWKGPNITLKSTSGKFIIMKPNGTLAAIADNDDDPKCLFTFTLINRPILVLRGEYGFVSPKTAEVTGRLECNRSNYQVFHVKAENGVYYLCGSNGKPWAMDADTKTFTANGSDPFPVHFELVRHTRMLIKAANGAYIRGEANGTFSAIGSGLDKETLWEY